MMMLCVMLIVGPSIERPYFDDKAKAHELISVKYMHFNSTCVQAFHFEINKTADFHSDLL